MSDPRFGHSYSKDSTCHIFCGFLTYPRKVTRILLGDPRVSRYNMGDGLWAHGAE